LLKDALAAINDYEASVVGYPVKPGNEIREEYFKKVSKQIEKNEGVVLVAEDERKALGFLVGFVSEDDDVLVDEAFNRFAYVSDVFVVPEARGKGVGQKLLDEFRRLMKVRGLKWVRIGLKSKNKLALSSYLKNGFEEYETVLVAAL